MGHRDLFDDDKPEEISSMKPHRNLDMLLKSAERLTYRLSRTLETDSLILSGPVNEDETFMGKHEKNQQAGKRLCAALNTVGKTAIDRTLNQANGPVIAVTISDTKATTLQSRVIAYTDDIEASCSLLKFDDNGTLHYLIPRHLDFHVVEFSGRHNVCNVDTIEPMGFLAREMVERQLRYHDGAES